MLNSSEVKRVAAEVGFDACGLARADALTEQRRTLHEWIARGWHAGLGYMERNVDKRLDPRLLVEGARTVVSVARGYNPSRVMQGSAKIARYAYGEDYHEVIKAMLFALKERLGIEGKVCCDTVPISDKQWAARAGIGWIGRHTLLVTPQWGSWVNLGEIVTTEEADRYDTPVDNPCRDCGLCVQACPNGALAADGAPMVDLRRCTAYHTIESREECIPGEVETGEYVFGCDLCQLACPYNRRPGLATREVTEERLQQLEQMTEAGEDCFRQAVAHSAMSRVGYGQWRRNLMASKQSNQQNTQDEQDV